MSTWTSERGGVGIWRARWLAALAGCLLLSACFEAEPLNRAAGRLGLAASGPASVTVLDGAMTVTGPDGYCIDEEATRESGSEAFVFFARCRPGMRASPVLSATVTGHAGTGSASAADLRRLADFLDGQTGRAQLSRRGRAGDVRIEETLIQDGVLWLRIHDAGNPEALHPAYWRAILPVGERVVTLSVMSSRAHPVGGARELEVLRAFVARMRGANTG